MSYTVERVDADKALRDIEKYRYALLYMISEIVFCRVEDIGEQDWKECLEARFFDEEKELHIYEEDGVLCAMKVVGALDEDCLIKKYELADRYCDLGRALCVCEHLRYDEDGQVSVALTRLAGIE